MNKVELLAPAKNLETAIAAINCGADAVYIGADSFGARVNAKNNLEDIKTLVDYAHKFYARVHVTINTILNDYEIKRAKDLIFKLYAIGVDAIIIQDFGLLELANKGLLPPIQIHMSTQCDNRTLEKAKFFDKIGASRIILARELSLRQINDICKSVNCEVETFVHGALCVSYSGQCYLSYANGGRSANRGECAQPCRKRYTLVDERGKVIAKDKYLLSLKDFNASKYLSDLVDIGVKSFKIEGRLKDLNYVKTVVLYYNNLLSEISARSSSGRVFSDFAPDVNKVFNRGYTDYFLEGRKNCFNFDSPKFLGEIVGKVTKVSKNYFETDAKLNPQDGICIYTDGSITGFLVNRVEGCKIYPNKIDNIVEGAALYRNSDSLYEKNLKRATIKRKIGVSILVSDSTIIAKDEDGNIANIPIPKGEIASCPENVRNVYAKQLSKLGDSDFYLTEIRLNQEIIDFHPVSVINDLRRNLLQKLINVRLDNYNKNVQKHISYADFPANSVDYRANIMNDLSEKFYKNCNCKVCEHALETCPDISSGVELMRTKHCLRYAYDLCLKNKNSIKDNLYIVDEKGKRYLLDFDCKNCEMVILNP